MAPPSMGEAAGADGAGGAAAGGSSGGDGNNGGSPRPPPYAHLESSGDDEVSWAGDGSSAGGGSGGGSGGGLPTHDLNRLPSTSSSTPGPVMFADEAGAASAGSDPRPEEEDEGEMENGGRGKLTVSISALSLSSAAEHYQQQQKQQEPPATPLKMDPALKGGAAVPSTESGHHHTAANGGAAGSAGLVPSPTTGSTSSTAASSSLPIPAFPKEDEEEDELMEAGGGTSSVGDVARPHSTGSTPLGRPKSLAELEEGGSGIGGPGSSGLPLLSPRNSFGHGHGHGAMECPPSPMRSDDGGDVRSSVSQMLEDFLHLPKWQFRLMVGVIVFLFSSLVILIILSTLYGFMLNMSHVKVTAVDLALPFPHVDKQGNVPVRSVLLLSNSNPFPVRTGTTHVDIFADKNMTLSVGHATVPPMTLHAHEDEHQITFNYTIPLAHTTNGADLVKHVLNKEASFFYTVSRIPVKVRALGLVPMTRHLKVNCEILRDWAHEGVLLSDCASRFV